MTAQPVPEWTRHLPPVNLTASEYDRLPEHVCRNIEVVDGRIIMTPSPTRWHRDISRRLANVIEAACGPSLRVSTDVDLRLSDVPLHNRRPDIVVYTANLPDDEPLRPEHTVLVAEVVSPGSETTDRNDKHAEYQAAGISHYWRVETVHGLTVWTYQIDPATRTYAAPTAHTDTFKVAVPIELNLLLSTLTRSRA